MALNKVVAVRELTGGKDFDIWYKSICNAFRAAGIYNLLKTKGVDASVQINDKDHGTGLMIITNSLSDVGQRYILECESVADAIAKLKPLYSKEETTLSLDREFESLKWTNQSAEVFINELNRIKSKLQQLDPNITSSRFIAKLLSECPQNIDHVKRKYEMRDMQEKLIDYDKLQLVVIKAYKRELLNQSEKRKSDSNQQQTNANHSFFHNRDLRKPFRSKQYRSNYNQANQSNQNNRSNQSNGPFHKKCRQYHPFGQCPLFKCVCGQNHYPGQCPNNRSQLFNSPQTAINSNSNQPTNVNSNTSSNNTTNPVVNQPNNVNRNRSTPQNANVPNQQSMQLTNSPLQFCHMLKNNGLNPNKLYLDNCGTDHSTGDLSILSNYVPFDNPTDMISSNGGVALGKGEIKVISHINDQSIPITLVDVLYLPNSPITIVSQLKFEDKGCTPHSSTDKVFNYINLIYDNQIVLSAKRKINSPEWRLYVTSMQFQPRFNFMTLNQAHNLLAHANDRKILNTSKCVSGLVIEDESQTCSPNCNTCIISKSRNRTFNHKLCKEQTPGFVLHTDINEVQTQSIGGSRYAIVFVDEASRYKRTYYLKTQTADEVLNKIKQCFTDQFYDLGYIPKRLHSDKGTNFKSAIVQNYLIDNLVKFTDSTAYNHQQNGLAEKTHLDLTNMTNALINAHKSPKRIWSVAMNYATYISNRLHHSSINTTPFEYYFGYKPNLGQIREFGTKVLVHIPKNKRSGKFSPKAKVMLFAGFTNTSVNYLVMDPQYKFVSDVTSVYFMNDSEHKTTKNQLIETTILNDTSHSESDQEDILDQLQGLDLDDDQDGEIDLNQIISKNDEQTFIQDNFVPDLNSTIIQPNELVPKTTQNDSTSTTNTECETTIITNQNAIDTNTLVNQQAETTNLDSINEQIQTPINQIYEYYIKTSDVIVPTTISEVMSNVYKEIWLSAMDEEYLNWLSYDAFQLVPATGREKLIKSHWIFSVKSNEDNVIIKFKARLVLDGSQIKEKPEYSPVANTESLRCILSFAAKNKLHLHTLDFTSAYLNSEMKTDYYMNQIPLYDIPNLRNHICKLNKWTYGLPASGYEWYGTLRTALQNLGFEQSKLDDCIFYDPNSKLIILVYVDDLLIACDNLETVNTFKHLIGEKFKCKDGGIIKRFLGIDFVYQIDKQLLYMSLKPKILSLYNSNMHNLPNPTKVPLDHKTILDQPSEPTNDIAQYRSRIGSVNFIARVRPDITTYVNRLSKYMKQPTKHHEQLLFKLISYLYNTINVVLCYDGTRDGGLVAYSDSDYISKNTNDAKSYSGAVVFYNQMPLLWCTKKQSIIASDNCQSELYAMNFTLNKLLSINNLMVELNMLNSDELQLKLFVDNRSAKIVAEHGLGLNSRHYNIALLYIKDFILRKQLKIVSIKSEQNIADLYTKFVINSLFYQFRDKLNLINLNKRQSLRVAKP